ncbi:MAG: thiamine-phosphate kinase, partial [Flavobacteriales bacterium]|nr:thiamine-phosphate kinase [Flavobacteriales bacterium]
SACDTYKVDLVGGDTSSSLSGLVLTITALGKVGANEVVKRSGAKPNDLICVTGDLGGAYMGLQVLEREKKVFQDAPGVQPALDGYDYILRRQLKPEARTDMRTFFEAAGMLPTSMIDISDGLASEILHITKASGCGCRLYEEKLPVDPMTIRAAEEFGLDPTTCALNGGEDYELLFTIDQSDYDKVKGSPHITVIGHITAESAGNKLIARSGTEIDITAQGWMAFRG